MKPSSRMRISSADSTHHPMVEVINSFFWPHFGFGRENKTPRSPHHSFATFFVMRILKSFKILNIVMSRIDYGAVNIWVERIKASRRSVFLRQFKLKTSSDNNSSSAFEFKETKNKFEMKFIVSETSWFDRKWNDHESCFSRLLSWLPSSPSSAPPQHQLPLRYQHQDQSHTMLQEFHRSMVATMTLPTAIRTTTATLRFTAHTTAVRYMVKSEIKLLI